MRYWLVKSEPSVFSIEDLQKDGFTNWDGVRNYQARNYLRDEMKVGDLALFYHSNAKPPGIAGVCRIIGEGSLDKTAYDPESPHYDPDTSKKPTWFSVEMEFVEKFPHFVPLAALKRNDKLEGMKILQKGSRLSITPVSHEHFEIIRAMGL